MSKRVVVQNKTEKQSPRHVRILKKFSLTFLAVLTPFILSCALFFIWTAQFPDLSTAGRTKQIIGSYFSTKQPVVIRTAHLQSAGALSWLAFQKDPYFDSTFGLEEDLEKMFKTEDLPYDNRVLVFDRIDIGIFTPIVEFVWPFVKTYEISIRHAREPDEADSVFSVPRVWDAVIVDLDSDGYQEIITYWMNYGGGSGASYFPLVINFSEQGKVSCETFPFVIRDKVDKQFTISPPKEYVFLVNGRETNIPCIRYNTDCFWDFRDIDSDSKLELVVAIPQGDWEYHYGKQSWLVAVFSYSGKRFVPKTDYSPFIVPKSAGLGLPEIHGYSFVPDYGLINYLLLPSWMELRSQTHGLTKARRQSAVWELLKEKREQRLK